MSAARSARTAAADRAFAAGTCLTLQVRPHTDQAGQQILVLRQFHLQAAFLRLGALGKDVQNQTTAVDDLHAQQLCQHADLGRGQIIIEDNHGGMFLLHHRAHFLHLTLTDKAVGVGFLAALHNYTHAASACRFYKGSQLCQALLISAVFAQDRRTQTYQYRVISLLFFLYFQFHNVPRSFGVTLL